MPAYYALINRIAAVKPGQAISGDKGRHFSVAPSIDLTKSRSHTTRRWRMSAKPQKLPTAADTDAELISKQLLAKAESLVKAFPRFGDIEELKKAPEWQTLNGFFRAAGKAYAIASHRKGDRRAWVMEKLRSDRDAIGQLNAFRVFRIQQIGRSNAGIEQIRSALEEKLDFAMNEGMGEAGKYIGESEALHRDRHPAGRRLCIDESRTPVQGTPPRTVPARTTRPDKSVGETGIAAAVPSKRGPVRPQAAGAIPATEAVDFSAGVVPKESPEPASTAVRSRVADIEEPNEVLAKPERDSDDIFVRTCQEHPEDHPTMSRKQAARALHKSQGTVRRWENEGKLIRATAPGRVMTASVLAWIKPRSSDT
jgi:hypothetical protein